MVNNIKTEIIYYCTPTDFELEFNLCGSCQMRLLTSTANDTSSLLKALQRSISRSRVIIITGKILGEDSIINLVSKSIGYTCEKIDTNVYDINAEDDLLIIKNSVPLITDSGDFGGCIIESGPQSMIFLSDDKKMRKEIMTNLVHGYIKDLSEYPVQAAVKTEEIPVVTEPETEEEIIEAEITNDTDKNIEQPEEVTEEINAEEITPEEVSDNPVIEPEEDPFNINNLLSNDDAEPFKFDTDNIVFEDDEYDEPATHKSHGNKILDILTLILSVILLLVLAFVVYSYIYLPLNNGISIEENFKNVFGFLIG